MRILLAEDDTFLSSGLLLVLRDSGFLVDHAEDGVQADIALATTKYDLAVLDLGLPGIDGLDVLRKLRRRNDDTPVLVLSARDQVSDRVCGLDAGANDYLSKPFEMAELEARIRALLRKSWQSQCDVTVGALRFETASNTVFINENRINLARRETAVLEVLLKHRGSLVSRERIIDQLSSWDRELTANALDIAVHRLRKKLDGAGFTIRTMRKLGYVID